MPQAPIPPKKNSNGGKVVLTIIGVLIVLFAIGKCGASGEKTLSSGSNTSSHSATGSAAAPAKPASPTAAPAGSAVRDGKFEFQVLSVARAQQAGDPSNQFETVQAQGEFIIVTMSVTNVGDRAQSYFGTNQKLFDTAGRQYEANSAADMWANKGTGDINPGNSIRVKAAFDVPPGTQPAELELHDSMFSGGVKVHL